MSSRLWAVIRREYLERVRSKAFIIGTILGPILLGGMMVFPALMARQGGGLLRVAIVDRSGQLQQAVENALRQAELDGEPRFEVEPDDGEPPAVREARLREAVQEARLDGYLVLPEEALTASRALYYGRTVSNRMALDLMGRTVEGVVVSQRLLESGLDVERVKTLTRDLDWQPRRLPKEGEGEGEEEDDVMVQILFAVMLLMILYTSILMWGQGAVMTSIIEEKSSRVIEVVASGVPPTQLLAGKLLGVGAVGLTQYVVWSLSLLGVSLAVSPMAGSAVLPEISGTLLVSFVSFFVLGFGLYASLYAAIGAAVNTVQEAQNFVFPVILPLVLGLMCFPVVLEAPDSTLTVVLSLVPLLSPLLMFLRIIVLPPPPWQVALSLALLGVSIAGALWMAARIYRVGILMYGKRPTFPGLMRWVRHS